MDGPIGFSTTQSVGHYLEIHLPSKINFKWFFEHRINFLLKKATLWIYLKKLNTE